MRKTYVCKRSRLCTYLMSRGFAPYKITPDRDNPQYNVYLFTASPELHASVMEWIKERNLKIETEET